MVRASSEGRLDFREARPFDRQWWIKVGWVLDALEAESVTQLNTLRHARYCSALKGTSDPDKYWKLAQEVEEDVRGRLLPWLGDPETLKEQGRKELAEAWTRVFGDQNDPEVARKIDETVAFLKRLRKGEVR